MRMRALKKIRMGSAYQSRANLVLHPGLVLDFEPSSKKMHKLLGYRLLEDYIWSICTKIVASTNKDLRGA